MQSLYWPTRPLLSSPSSPPDIFFSWLPAEALHYCLVHTQCKLIILDPDRADLLEPNATRLVEEARAKDCLVIESHEGKGHWIGMKTWSDVLDRHTTDIREILNNDPGILPEDNATVIFTSGTSVSLLIHSSIIHPPNLRRTGLPKGVLSTQRMFLTNVLNVRPSWCHPRPIVLNHSPGLRE